MNYQQLTLSCFLISFWNHNGTILLLWMKQLSYIVPWKKEAEITDQVYWKLKYRLKI
jgi:hypothetical protein